MSWALTGMAQFVGHHTAEQKVASLIPAQVHAWAMGPNEVGACARGNQLIFLSHIDVSVFIFLPPVPSLSKKITNRILKKRKILEIHRQMLAI